MVLADSLPRIRDAVARTLAGGNDACVTFQIAGDERAWVQLAYGTINCAYPRSEPPSVDALPAQLVSALGGIEIVGWEPGNFVTYGFARPEADAITLLVEWLRPRFPALGPASRPSISRTNSSRRHAVGRSRAMLAGRSPKGARG